MDCGLDSLHPLIDINHVAEGCLMVKAVLFDFDYTLVDSSRAVIECVNHALRDLRHEEAAGDTIRRTIG